MEKRKSWCVVLIRFDGQIKVSLRFCQPDNHNYGKNILSSTSLYHSTNFPKTLFFPLVQKHTLTKSGWMPIVTCTGPPASSPLPVPLKPGWVIHLFFIPISTLPILLPFHLFSHSLPWPQPLVHLKGGCSSSLFSVSAPAAGGEGMTPDRSSRALKREVTTATVPTVKNTIQQDQIRDQKTEFSTSFRWRAWQSSSTRRQREQGKRQVRNKHRYPLEGTNQIKSLWHFSLTGGWESTSKSESNLLLWKGKVLQWGKIHIFFHSGKKKVFLFIFVSYWFGHGG